MSATEMHAFEKAMQDDPFLMDAVDGYMFTANPINLKADLGELQERLSEKKQKTAVVVKGSFRQWISIAATLVVLLSASVVLYRIFAVPEPSKIAQNKTYKKVENATQEQTTPVDSNTVAVNEKTPTRKETNLVPAIDQKPAVVELKPSAFAEVETKPLKEQPVNTAPVPAFAQTKKGDLADQTTFSIRPEEKKQPNAVALNQFTGIVVDENNQPLPFANIKETSSGVGTYADVNGRFTLISADSILNVETKSVGYFSNSLLIKKNQSQKIVLRDEAVLANAPSREKLYERNKDRHSVMKTEITEMESEPQDGWNNYNTYIVNNLRADDIKSKKQTPTLKEVEVSFDVNPDGSLANLKIEHSNCTTCNPEAIRIISEGPKWKSKTGKKERARLTLQF